MSGGERKRSAPGVYIVFLLDVAVTMSCYALSILARGLLRFDGGAVGAAHSLGYLNLFLLLLLYKLFADGTRDFFTRGLYAEFVEDIRYTVFLTLGLLLLVFYQGEIRAFSRFIFGVFGCLELVVTYLSHLLLRSLILRAYRTGEGTTKVLVVTERKRLQQVLGRLRSEEGWNLNVSAAALLSEGENLLIRETAEGETEELPLENGPESLYEIARQLPLDEVLIDLPDNSAKEIRGLILSFESMGLVCHYNVDILDVGTSERSIEDFAGFSVVSYALKNLDARQMFLKRIMDILGGFVGLFFTALLTPFVALAIKLDSPGPVFFAQERIGRNGRRFTIYKFRSMYQDAEQRKAELSAKNEMQGLMFKMEKDPRITKVGRFLRKTSIDEFPQFFNVLNGSMSLVGTRPPTVDEFEKYDLYYRRRMSITPGLTGMWQVYGRGVVTDFDEVVKYDLEYIDNWSLGLDIKLLIKTVGVVLFGKGSV